MPNRSREIAVRYLYNGFSISRGNSSPMTKRHRPSSVNCRAEGQTEYNLARNASRSSSKASHSNNVCWIVSDSRDSQQGHCALRTSCVRLLELRRSWQPIRNFVFNLRPSRRDAGHALSKYSGKPKRTLGAAAYEGRGSKQSKKKDTILGQGTATTARAKRRRPAPRPDAGRVI